MESAYSEFNFCLVYASLHVILRFLGCLQHLQISSCSALLHSSLLRVQNKNGS